MIGGSQELRGHVGDLPQVLSGGENTIASYIDSDLYSAVSAVKGQLCRSHSNGCWAIPERGVRREPADTHRLAAALVQRRPL